MKLTPDTRPRVVTHYLDPPIDAANREWQLTRSEGARSEGRARPAAWRAATEWADIVDALQRFRNDIEAVIQGPQRAQPIPANAKWLPRAIAQATGGRDVGRGYHPDIDLGARVNIAPLVVNQLFPRAVLMRLGS